MEHQTPGDLWAIQHGNRKRRSFLAEILGDVGFRIWDIEFEFLGFGLGSEARAWAFGSGAKSSLVSGAQP